MAVNKPDISRRRRENHERANILYRPILYINLAPFYTTGLCIGLVVFPLMRGLFFPEERLPALIWVCAMYVLAIADALLKREALYDRLLRPLPDRALLALVLTYALSLITAVHLGEAVYALMSIAACFMVYRLGVRVGRKEKAVDRLLFAIYLGGIAVAVIGILAAAKIFNFPGAYVNKTILSTLQYKNALAAYLASVTAVGLALSVKKENLAAQIFYALGNCLMAVVTLATLSRAGWIVYAAAIAAVTLLIPAALRWRALFHFFIFAGCAVIGGKLFYSRLETLAGLPLISYVLYALAVAAVLQVLYRITAAYLNRDTVTDATRRLAAAGGVLYMVAVAALYLYYAAAAFPVSVAQVMPGEVIAKGRTISRADSSFLERIEYNRDALKIVADHPVTGAGGGGWNALYHSYADRIYWTREVHNHFMQTWVESGTIGFLCLLAFWLLVVLTAVRYLQHEKDEGKRISYAAAIVGAGALTVHSIFDFDMSLTALAFVVYALAGVLQGMEENRAGEYTLLNDGNKKWPYYLLAASGMVLALALIVVSSRFYTAGTLGAQGAQALLEKRFDSAERLYLEAVRYNPLEASYHGDLAQIYAIKALAHDDAIARYDAIREVKYADRLSPYDWKVRTVNVNILGMLKEYDLAASEARGLLEANPYLFGNYEALSTALIEQAIYHIRRGETDKTSANLREVILLPEKARKKGIEPTDIMLFNQARAYALTGQFGEAREILTDLQNSKRVKDGAAVWLAAVLNITGSKDEAAEICEKLDKNENHLSIVQDLTMLLSKT